MKPKMEGRRRRCCYWAGRAAAAALSFRPFLLALRLQCTTLLGNSSIQYTQTSPCSCDVCVCQCVWDWMMPSIREARLYVSLYLCVCVQSGSSGGSSSQESEANNTETKKSNWKSPGREGNKKKMVIIQHSTSYQLMSIDIERQVANTEKRRRS